MPFIPVPCGNKEKRLTSQAGQHHCVKGGIMKHHSLLVICFLCLITALGATTSQYRVLLEWDEMSGELNGVLSGIVDSRYGFIQGTGAGQVLDGAISYRGENNLYGASQEFYINRMEGYYSFWIRDKFADDDINPDPWLIKKAQARVSVFRGNLLLGSTDAFDGTGLTCKVFTLDAANATLDIGPRFFPRTRLFAVMTVDAVSGDGLQGVSISVSGGEDHYPSVTTDNSGFAFIPVETGSYRLHIVKEGYINTNFKVEMGFDENPREFVFAIAPKAKDFRIVLTWGSRPNDLDAHLSGPHPEGGNFHIWYRNRVLIAGRDFLDRDDTDKYGPETVTIYKPASGEYHFFVHDYSNRADRSSRTLSFSDAVVQVYADETLKATFRIPEDQYGNLWDVFRIDKNQNLVSVNTVGWTDDEKNIR